MRSLIKTLVAGCLFVMAGWALAQTVEERASSLIKELITDPPIVIVQDEVQVGAPSGSTGPNADYQVVPKLEPGSPEYEAKVAKLREKRRREIQAKLIALGPPAVPTIGSALKNQALPYREYLAEALAKIGDIRAVPYLIEYLAEGLSKLRYSDSLEKAGEHEMAKSVRRDAVVMMETATAALKSLTGTDYGADPAPWREWWERNRP